MPWAWYSDPAVARLEQERIFARTWQYVGHSGRLARDGDFFPCLVGSAPVVVVRDDGVERAFLNVCRHRGSLLVEEAGNRRTLQCPYHAWTYALDGALRSAPRSEREGGFELSELPLVPVRLERWEHFLFVSIDADAPPLADVLEGLPELLARAGLDLGALRFRHRVEWDVEANWKIVCENFLECYHCAVAHPGFSDLVDVGPDAYTLQATAGYSSQFGPVRDGARTPYDADGDVKHGQFHFIWPNTGINVFPGRQNLSIGSILPRSPDRSHRFLDYFFGDDAEEQWIGELLEFDDQVGREDTRLIELVQQGAGSGALDSGRLLPASEQLVADFQQRVAAALA